MASNRYRLGPVSAYAIAVQNGFQGTEQQWLESLSAYGLAVKDGFAGTLTEWLESLHATDDQVAAYLISHPEVLQQMNPMRGSVNTLAQLPTSGNAVNDTYYVQSEKYPVTWTGSEWVRSGINETDYADELAETKAKLAAVKSVHDGLEKAALFTWENGNLAPSDGRETDTAGTVRVRTQMCTFAAYTISPEENVSFSAWFYGASGQFLGNAGPYTEAVNLEDIAPNGAERFRLLAKQTQGADPITPAFGEKVLALGPKTEELWNDIKELSTQVEEYGRRRFELDIKWEAYSLASIWESEWDVSRTTPPFSSEAYPLGDYTIVPEDGASFYLWFYNDNTYLGNGKHNGAEYFTEESWNEPVDVLAVKPDGTTHFRIELLQENTTVHLYGSSRAIDDKADEALALAGRAPDPVAISWEQGNLSASTGGASNVNASKRIRSKYMQLRDYTVRPKDGYPYYVYWYDSNEAYLGTSQRWIYTPQHLPTLSPYRDAYGFRLVVKSGVDRDITPADGAAISLLIPTEEILATLSAADETLGEKAETAAAKAGRLPGSLALTWSFGRLSDSTGAPADGNKAYLKTALAPMGDYGAAPESGYLIRPYYYDAAGNYLGAASGWSAGAVDIHGAAPENAAQFRLGMQKESGEELSLDENARVAFLIPSGEVLSTLNAELEDLHSVLDLYGLAQGEALVWEQTASPINIKSQRVRIRPYTIVPKNGARFTIFYYDASGVGLGQGTDGWLSEAAGVEDYVLPGAVFFGLQAINRDGTEITPAFGENIRMLMPKYTEAWGNIESLTSGLDLLSKSVFTKPVEDFQLGGIKVSDGSESSANYRMRTGYHPLGQYFVDWKGTTLQWLACYFDAEKRFLSATEFTEESGVVQAGDVENAAYVRFVFGKGTSYDFSTKGLALADGSSIRGTASADQIEALRADFDQAATDLQERLTALDTALGWVEWDLGIEWVNGTLHPETGQASDRSPLRIRTGFAELGNYIIRPDEGYVFRVFYYDAAGAFLGGSSGGGNGSPESWLSTQINLSQEAPAGAAQFRLVATKSSLNSETPPTDGAHIHGFIPTPGYLATIKGELEAKIDEQGDELGGRIDAQQNSLEQSVNDLAAMFFSEEIKDFQLGGLKTSNGAESNAYARMRTGFHPVGKIRVSWGDPEFQYLVCYYRQDKSFISATAWSSETRVISADDVEGAAYVRFCFWNAVLQNGYSFYDNGLFLPEGDVIYGSAVAAANIELDDSLTVSGMAADAAAVGGLLSRMGWIRLPAFIQGTRVMDNTIRSTAKTITMETPVQVGSGKALNVDLAEGWACSLNYSASPEGPWTKAVTQGTSGRYVTRGEYLFVNLVKYVNGVSVDVTPQSAALEQALVLSFGPDAAEGGESASLRYDMPENLGVINLRKRARQLTEISYSPANEAGIPWYNSSTSGYQNIGANGASVIGLPYNGVWELMQFVPQNVSFHSYMTMMMNPKSYLFTRQTSDGNNRTYFGTVCSAFASYCYGLEDGIQTTATLEKIDGMTLNEDQSAYGLKLGDLLSKPYNHVAVVVDILRDQTTGEIQTVYIAEGWKPLSRRRGYSPESYKSQYIDQGYHSFRWSKLYGVSYEATPWVNVGEEDAEPSYNGLLFPRRGDRANWPYSDNWTDPVTGETVSTSGLVEIDIIGATAYTLWRLYLDDGSNTMLASGGMDAAVNISSNGVSGTGTWNSTDALIKFNTLSPGFYKLCLSDGTNESDYVYFCVTDSNETYTKTGAAAVRCSAASAQGTPLSLYWGNREGTANMAVVQTDAFPASTTTVEASRAPGEAGVYPLRVCYRNQYGMWFSKKTSVDLS